MVVRVSDGMRTVEEFVSGRIGALVSEGANPSMGSGPRTSMQIEREVGVVRKAET